MISRTAAFLAAISSRHYPRFRPAAGHASAGRARARSPAESRLRVLCSGSCRDSGADRRVALATTDTAPRVESMPASRHDRARPINRGALAADHQLVRVVRLLTDVLEELRARVPLKLEIRGPPRSVGTRIVHGDLVLDDVVVHAREALDRMHLLRMRQTAAVEPEPLVEAHAVDDERAALPPADRVTVVRRRQVLRMRAAVHVHGAEGVRAADIEDVEPLRGG